MKTPGIIRLQKLVLEELSPTNLEMTPEQIEQWMIQLPQIGKELLQMMSNSVFGFLQGKLVRRHLGQLRKECTVMLDVLHGYPDCTGEREKLREGVLNCLIAVLKHLQLHYNKHLDANVAMPAVLYHVAAQKIEQNAEHLVTLMTRYNADKRLQAVVLSKMTLLLKKGKGTWHQINYLERLQCCILELCVGSITNITGRLKMLLLQTNFNTSGFIGYCKNEIDEEIAACCSIPEQYKCIFQLQREFNSSYKHKFLRFEPSLPKIKEKLMQYVKAELSMMDARYRVATAHKVTERAKPNHKLPVSISVNMLAYLFRLLFTVGVVTGHKSDLLVFISRNFHTPGAGEEDLSLKSIENKYRQVVEKTAMSVRSILLKMLKQLDDEFTRHKLHGTED